MFCVWRKNPPLCPSDSLEELRTETLQAETIYPSVKRFVRSGLGWFEARDREGLYILLSKMKKRKASYHCE